MSKFTRKLAAILDFEKATWVASGRPGLNFIDTLGTIEKSKETIVKRPNKVMGPATRLNAVSAV